MLAEIKNMPPDSRIWIYQANRTLSQEEIQIVEERCNSFFSNWESHGHELRGSYKFYRNIFLVIALDEQLNSASGCSIDKSVGLIKLLEQDLNITLLDRSAVAYLDNGNIKITNLKDLKKIIGEGIIGPETLVFNNMVGTLSDLEKNWEVPANKTWISKYF